MGYLKDIANQPKIQSFPNSTFEISGDVPASQCLEALIGADDATTIAFINSLRDDGAFIGHDLTNKNCRITASVGGATGDFLIQNNDDNFLTLAPNPGDGDPVTYHITNGAEFIFTRDMKSFANFISTAGYAYTIKGNKLHTNIPSAQLQPACKVTFDPLT